MKNWLPFVSRLDAHHRVLIAAGFAGLVLLLIRGQLPLTFLVVVTWLSFALALLLLTWTTILTLHPRQMSRAARLQDTGQWVLLLFVVGAAFFSLFAIILLLRSSSGLSVWQLRIQLTAGVLTVASSWLLVHTVFALHYARLYYNRTPSDTSQAVQRGLDFPQETEPDYWDFAYFSFVIGMTSQVSDVSVTSQAMRRLALLHGVLSFAFNTVVVALTINVVFGLLNR